MLPDLARFDNSWYSVGRPRWVQAAWLLFGLPLLRCSMPLSSGFRCGLLRLFGARIGKGVVIKPGVRVKYPWLFSVGDHTWIGEDCWIDNLAAVTLGSNVCVSQRAYFCTGNHDWSDPAFGLKLGPIGVKEGAWVGAHAIVGPGVVIAEGAVVAIGSVITSSVDAFTVVSGNPACFLKQRRVQETGDPKIGAGPRETPA